MGKFEALVKRSGHPAEVQDSARRELPSLLAKSNLHSWTPGDPIQAQGIRFVIGIAVWSVYDMRLLDALDQVLSQRAERVDVFNVDDCSTMECLRDYVPLVGKIYDSPIVGTWQDGKQVNQCSGAIAREMVAQYFGINHNRLIALPSEQ
jgi:hypothetical protein